MNLKLENIFLFSRILCDIESNVGQMFLKMVICLIKFATIGKMIFKSALASCRWHVCCHVSVHISEMCVCV